MSTTRNERVVSYCPPAKMHRFCAGLPRSRRKIRVFFGTVGTSDENTMGGPLCVESLCILGELYLCRKPPATFRLHEYVHFWVRDVILAKSEQLENALNLSPVQEQIRHYKAPMSVNG